VLPPGAELWSSATDWIAVDAASTSIALTADPFPGVGATHSPGSYAVIPEPPAAALVMFSLAGLLIRQRG